MLPDIASQERNVSIGKGTDGVRGIKNFQLSGGVFDKPGPSKFWVGDPEKRREDG